MHQSGGKIKPVFRQFLPYFSIIQPFQILIERFQNISNKTLRKHRCLNLPNVANTKVAEFIK